MKRAIVLAALSLAPLTSAAAQSPREEVLAVVNRLFDGMRAGDSAMVRSVFDSTARLMTATPERLSAGSIDRFVTAIGTPHDSVWDEPIWDISVQIDGNLATVWTKYAFYLGSRFSHCGVDAFQLYRRDDGWKIVQLTDTRQRDGCERPPGR